MEMERTGCLVVKIKTIVAAVWFDPREEITTLTGRGCECGHINFLCRLSYNIPVVCVGVNEVAHFHAIERMVGGLTSMWCHY